MFRLVKGGTLFSPEEVGRRDILLCGGKVAWIAEHIETGTLPFACETVDADGLIVAPGFIDGHVHVLGGGGEAGYATRTPEVMLGDATGCGITTVVGVLGTDGTTRHLESLVAKVRALTEEGISAYMYTGSYEIPVVTLTGSVHKDMVLIGEVIGCGEVAVSDHRSSYPTKEELGRIASQCRIGGMLSGKAGVLHLHMGDGKGGLRPLVELVAESDIPIRQFYPTHVNRNPDLMREALAFARMGGVVDVTSCISREAGVKRAVDCARAIREYLDQGGPPENITMSSDGNGSMAILDDDGKPVGLLVAELRSLHAAFVKLVRAEGVALADALKIVTSNVADYLKLKGKGRIDVGADADIVMLNEALDVVYVVAKGRPVVRHGVVVAKGTFER